MKVSVIHNLYKKNRFVNETTMLNLMALNDSNVDYQYILFNDHGDESVYDDVKHFINDRVEYIYSETNYGKKMCSGGWVGALPYVKGDLIQNIGQDDVIMGVFYKKSLYILENNSDIDLVFSNCFKVNEDLSINAWGINPQYWMDYTKPLDCFRQWFGVENNKVTRANNGIMASGTIYRKSLHDQIGPPNLDEFLGAADFEFWSRVLFYEHKCVYLNDPNWLYRMSEYSAGNEVVDGRVNRGSGGWQNECIQRIKDKYTRLWEEKYGK